MISDFGLQSWEMTCVRCVECSPPRSSLRPRPAAPGHAQGVLQRTGKAGGYTHTPTRRPDAHAQPQSRLGSRCSGPKAALPQSQACVSEAVLRSESLGFPFSGRRAFSGQGSLPGPGHLRPTAARPPLMSSFCPRRENVRSNFGKACSSGRRRQPDYTSHRS